MSSHTEAYFLLLCTNYQVCNMYHREYINLVSDDEVSEPPSPPPFSPLTPSDNASDGLLAKDILHIQKVKSLPVDWNIYQE